MSKVPKILIYSRLVIGIILVIISFRHIPLYNQIAPGLFTLGLLTDIFDGIIARHYHCSNLSLRRLDSGIDQAFFILVAIATYIQVPEFFYQHWLSLTILCGFESATYLICFLKFRKEIATHAISSKVWTLILFATIIGIMLGYQINILFQCMIYTGILSRIEIIAIILTIKSWASDVPGIYQAIQLRNGKTIKRHKLLNG